MLTISSLSFERERIPLFEDLNLTIHSGHRVGLVGRNGAGKSTLFQLILGRLHSDSGDINVPREWRISYLAQDPAVSQRPALEYVLDGDQPLRRAERKLAAAEAADDHMAIAELHGELADLGAYTAESRASEILHGLGFSARDSQRPYADFSGGWRIRLNLAQALMSPAELLLLDEPTNHLDLEATLWLESWLLRSPATLLTIAHDREFLDKVVDHIIHLEGHKAHSYRGNYTAFETQRADALAQQQANFDKQQRKVAHIEKFVARFRAKASKAKQVQSRLKALERMESVAPVYADSPYQFSFPDPEKMSQPLLGLNDLSIGYDGVPVLEHVKASLLPGARIGVLGENGAGKSTLLKCLVGDLEPCSGELVRGQHASIGYFAQHQLENLHPERSALSGMQLAHPAQREQWCRDYLGTWGFARDKVERPVATLSGGERARLVLAHLAAEKPAILVLDEPTNHLDLDMREALALALQNFAGALVIVAHDRSLLERTVDEFWLVENHTVTRLPGNLETYTQTHNRATLMLADQTGQAAADDKPGNTDSVSDRRGGPSGSRKLARQEAAAARAREKPLRQAIRKLEQQIENLSEQLRSVETRLADPEVYKTLPADDLDELLAQSGKLRKKRDDAEQAWLTTCEELEGIQQS